MRAATICVEALFAVGELVLSQPWLYHRNNSLNTVHSVVVEDVVAPQDRSKHNMCSGIACP